MPCHPRSALRSEAQPLPWRASPTFKAADFAEPLFKERAMFTRLLTGIECALETKQEMYKLSGKRICGKRKEEQVSSFSSPDMAFGG